MTYEQLQSLRTMLISLMQIAVGMDAKSYVPLAIGLRVVFEFMAPGVYPENKLQNNHAKSEIPKLISDYKRAMNWINQEMGKSFIG